MGISIHALREEGDSGQMCPAQRRAISIHALREEGDRVRANSQSSRSSFLSTPSARRATHYYTLQAKCAAYFYPRPPRGGRLASRSFHSRHLCISIHALREEGDLAALGEQPVYNRISIHALREEGDVFPQQTAWDEEISIHALREEGDRNLFRMFQQPCNISIHALREEGDLPSLDVS